MSIFYIYKDYKSYPQGYSQFWVKNEGFKGGGVVFPDKRVKGVKTDKKMKNIDILAI